MRHDWVLEVLDDLIAYARRNDLPGLATGAEAVRQAAAAELAAAAPSAAPSEVASALPGDDAAPKAGPGNGPRH